MRKKIHKLPRPKTLHVIEYSFKMKGVTVAGWDAFPSRDRLREKIRTIRNDADELLLLKTFRYVEE